jgi:hypothetical protein
LNSLAAFLLQRCGGAVRYLVMIFVCLAAFPARAQSGTGTCSGSSGMGMSQIAGVVGLARPGDLASIASATVPFVWGNAECQCANNTMGDKPLFLDIQLTGAFAMGTIGTAQIWYGLNCDSDNLGRTNSVSTTCEQDTTSGVTFSNFVVGGSPTSSHIFTPIDTAALFSPKTHICPVGQTSNGIFILFFTGNNSNPSGTPAATCTLVQTENLQGPGGPTGLSASSGDGAVSLNWGNPNPTLPPPLFYQVLCANEDGNPITNNPPQNIYSTCTPEGLQRRNLDTGGSLTTVPDGGLGARSESFGTESDPPAPRADATADGGTTTTDGGTTIGTTLPSPFTFLDKKFVCSDPIQIGTNNGTRIGGLTNGKHYQFVVVGVDRYGNATPNDNGIITATPQPVEDLYRRFRDSGGGASGFCFIATAAYGSYEHPYVQILREFRDQVLLPTRGGSWFVRWYYAHSPPAAAWISDHDGARAATRVALWPVIGFAAAWLYVPGWLKLVLFLVAVGWLLRRRLRPRNPRPA